MNDETNFNTSADTVAATAATVVAKAPLTKEEKIAKVVAEIDKLKQKLYNLENDIAPAARIKPVVVLPEVGERILFSYGRKTLTTNPVLTEGVVAALKPAGQAANGKTLPAQIKVQVGEGFDATFVVIYPSALVPAGTTQADVDASEDEAS